MRKRPCAPPPPPPVRGGQAHRVEWPAPAHMRASERRAAARRLKAYAGRADPCHMNGRRFCRALPVSSLARQRADTSVERRSRSRCLRPYPWPPALSQAFTISRSSLSNSRRSGRCSSLIELRRRSSAAGIAARSAKSMSARSSTAWAPTAGLQSTTRRPVAATSITSSSG